MNPPCYRSHSAAAPRLLGSAQLELLSAVVDGGIIRSKTLSQPRHLPEQVLLYRSFVKLIFAGA